MKEKPLDSSEDSVVDVVAQIKEKLALLDDSQVLDKIKLYESLFANQSDSSEIALDAMYALDHWFRLNPDYPVSLLYIDGLLTHLEKPIAPDIKQQLIHIIKQRQSQTLGHELTIELLLRLGHLHLPELPTQAISFYQQALQKRPQFPATLSALQSLLEYDEVSRDAVFLLEPIYTAKQDYQMLALLLQRKVAWVVQANEKKNLLRRIGDIYECRLQDKKQAFLVAQSLLEFDPHDMGVRLWAEKLAIDTPSQTALLDSYLKIAHDLSDAEQKQLHKRIVTLFQSCCFTSSPDAISCGITCYQALLSYPQWVTSDDRLRLLDLLLLRAQHCLACQSINDAVSAYQEVLSFIEQQSQLDCHDQQISVLQQLIALLENSDLTRAQVLRKKLLALYLTQTPRSQSMIQLAESIVQVQSDDISTWLLLLSLYESYHQDDQVIDAALRLLSVLCFGTEKIPVLLSAARACIRQSKNESAIGFLEQARAIDNTDSEIWNLLINVYRQEHRDAALLEVYKYLSDTPHIEASLQVQALVYLAEQQMQQDQNLMNAVSLWKRVLNLDPNHVQAARSLCSVYQTLGLFDDLIELLKILVKRFDSDVYFQSLLASLSSDQLGMAEEAIERWLCVLDKQPQHEQALRALFSLYQKTQDHHALFRVYEQLSSLMGLSHAHVFDMHESMLHYSLTHGFEPGIIYALEQWMRLLPLPQIAPRIDFIDFVVNALFLRQSWQQLTQLVNILHDLVADKSHWAQWAMQAASLRFEQQPSLVAIEEAIRAYAYCPDCFSWHQRICSFFLSLQSYRALLNFNEQYVKRYSSHLSCKSFIDPVIHMQIIEVLRQVRDVQHQDLKQPELAFLSACRVFRVSFLDEDANVLDLLAKETGSLEELVLFYEDMPEEAPSLGARMVSCLHLARACVKVQKLEQAQALYEQILLTEPKNQEALSVLTDLYAKQGLHDVQIEFLEQQLAITSDVSEKCVLLMQLAACWEPIQTDKAIDAYGRILQILPEHELALNELISLYTLEERTQDLVPVLERILPFISNPLRCVDLQLQLAVLYETACSLPDRAQTIWFALLKQNMLNEPNFNKLVYSLIKTQQHSKALDVLQSRLDIVCLESEQLILHQQIADLACSFLGQYELALVHVNLILTKAPGHLQALILKEQIQKHLGQYEELVITFAHHLTLVSTTQEVAHLYVRMAEIYHLHLARVDKAEEYYQLARSLLPDSLEAAQGLGKIYERTGNWFESLEVLRTQADRLGDSPQAAFVYFRMGKIYHTMLQDFASATGCYLRAVEINPEEVQSYGALKSIALTEEDWDQYVQYAQDEAIHSSSPVLQAELLYDLGCFCETQIASIKSNKEGLLFVHMAPRFFEMAYHYDPSYLPVLRKLYDLYMTQLEYAHAALIQKQVVALMAQEDKHAQALAWYQYAYVSEKQGDYSDTLDRCLHALAFEPNLMPALELLLRVYQHQKRYADAISVIEQLLTTHKEQLTPRETMAHLVLKGDLLLHSQRTTEASELYQQALQLDLEFAPALKALASLCTTQNDDESAYDYWMRYADAVAVDERPFVLLRMADICHTRLKDVYRAIDCLSEARRLLPKNTQILERLIVCFSSTKQLLLAAEATHQLLLLLSNPEQIIEYRWLLAKLYAKEGTHWARAIEEAQIILNTQPLRLDVFALIENTLAGHQEYQALEIQYRMMLMRLPKDAYQAKAALLRSLATLYEHMLSDLKQARLAREAALKLDPQPEEYVALGQLLMRLQQPARALDYYQQGCVHVHQQDMWLSCVQAVRQLSHDQQQFDLLFCACQSLIFLNQSTTQDEQIYQYLKKGVSSLPSASLTEQQVTDWLIHSLARQEVGDLCAFLAQHAKESLADCLPDTSKPKNQIDIASSRLFVVGAIKQAQSLLSLPSMSIYKKSDTVASSQLLSAYINGPSLVFGAQHPCLTQTDKSALYACLVPALLAAHPQLVLGACLSVADLHVVLAHVLAAVLPQTAAAIMQLFKISIQPKHPVFVFAERIIRQSKEAAQLKYLCEQAWPILSIHGTGPYLKGVELSLIAGSVVLSQDLTQACLSLKSWSFNSVILRTYKERQIALLQFFMSSANLQIRQQLGLSLQVEESAKLNNVF